MLTVLEAWRERGRAPSDVVATQNVGDRIGRTRPLCRYPMVAAYKGTGDLDRAESFACADPRR
jgi:feruloyl esterase